MAFKVHSPDFIEQLGKVGSKRRKTLGCNKPGISKRIGLEPEFLMSRSVSALLFKNTHRGKIEINLTSVWSSSDLLKNETMHS